jgi:hypothetical protein
MHRTCLLNGATGLAGAMHLLLQASHMGGESQVSVACCNSKCCGDLRRDRNERRVKEQLRISDSLAEKLDLMAIRLRAGNMKRSLSD